MKKALTLILIAAAIVAGFFSVRGEMPFMPVFGNSMEPTLQSGNLILVEEMAPAEVKVGDVIVYRVPLAIQDYYGYPPIVAHRVVRVLTDHGYAFRTKGDNSGEDPFTIRSEDLRGTVSKQIPYAGIPLLFLQSQQGLIFILVALGLFALYIFADEIGRGRRAATRGFFAPIIEESHRGMRSLSRKVDGAEQRMGETQQALNNFATAIELYAEHLKSHTSAIQGLSQASHELKRGAAEQNRVLARLMETMEQKPPQAEPIKAQVEPTPPPAEPVKPKIELVMPTVGHATPKMPKIKRVIHKVEPAKVKAEPVKVKAEPVTAGVAHAVPSMKKVPFPPGCYRSRRQLADQGEIFGAS
jgi:signal peptidase I